MKYKFMTTLFLATMISVLTINQGESSEAVFESKYDFVANKEYAELVVPAEDILGLTLQLDSSGWSVRLLGDTQESQDTISVAYRTDTMPNPTVSHLDLVRSTHIPKIMIVARENNVDARNKILASKRFGIQIDGKNHVVELNGKAVDEARQYFATH